MIKSNLSTQIAEKRKTRWALHLTIILTIAVCGVPFAESVDTSESINFHAEMPRFLDGKSATQFAWVSAEEILDSEGEIRYEYVAEWGTVVNRIENGRIAKRAGLDFVKEISDEDCKTIMTLHGDAPIIRNTVEFVQNASTVFTGRVIAIDHGFRGMFPGSLLKIEVDKIVKNSADVDMQEYVYVFTPIARFSVHGVNFCRGYADSEDRPKVGDRLLIISSSSVFDLGRTMVGAWAGQMIFEDKVTKRAAHNKYLKTMIEQNFDQSEKGDTLQLWGDDLPDLNTLAHQIREVCDQSSSDLSIEKR